MKLPFVPFVAALVIALTSCAVTTKDLDPEPGPIDVNVEGLPECCDGHLQVAVEITQKSPIPPHNTCKPIVFDALAANGKLNVKTHNGPEAQNNASHKLFWGHPISVKITISEVDECCLNLIRNQLGIPDLGRWSSVQKLDIPAGGTSGNVWTSNFDSTWHKAN